MTRISDRIQAALQTLAAPEDSAHQIDMSDPLQNVDMNVGTPVDQMRLALTTLQSAFSQVDGTVISTEDHEAINESVGVLGKVIDKIETKLAAYSVQNDEERRSDR